MYDLMGNKVYLHLEFTRVMKRKGASFLMIFLFLFLLFQRVDASKKKLKTRTILMIQTIITTIIPEITQIIKIQIIKI